MRLGFPIWFAAFRYNRIPAFKTKKNHWRTIKFLINKLLLNKVEFQCIHKVTRLDFYHSFIPVNHKLMAN